MGQTTIQTINARVDPPLRLAEAMREVDNVKALASAATNMAKPLRLACVALGAIAELHQQASQQLSSAVGSPAGMAMRRVAADEAEQRQRDIPPSPASATERTSIAMDAGRKVLRQLSHQVAGSLKQRATALGKRAVAAMGALDDGIAKLEAEARMPAGLRVSDSKAQLAELLKLGEVAETLRGMDPSELLRTWRDLEAIGDTERLAQFASRAKPLVREVVRKGAPGLKLGKLPRAHGQQAEAELRAAWAVLGELERWQHDREPAELKVARELRDRLRAAFRALCGQSAHDLPPAQFGMLLESGHALEKFLSTPYSLADAGQLAARFLPDRLGAKLADAAQGRW